MIKAFLYKDFKQLKTSIPLMLVIVVVLSLLMNQPGFGLTLSALLSASLVISTFALDERSGFEKEAIATSRSRKTVINEKYILMTIFVVAATLIAFSIELVADAARRTLDLPLLIFMLPVSISLGLFITSVAIPFTIKFGSEKARLITIISYLLPTVAFIFLAKKIDSEEASVVVFLLSIIIPALSITIASYVISCKLFDKKEF